MYSVVRQAPMIIAHSGCNGTTPNSLASIEAARQNGATAVEFDVQSTADGYPVLVHDPWIVRGGNTRVSVSALVHGDLQDTPEHPSLETVCDVCAARGLLLNLDIKDSDVLPTVYRILEERGGLDRTLLTGCRLPHALDRTQPGLVRTLINMTDEVTDPSFSQVLTEIQRTGFIGVNLEFTLLTRKVIDRIHEAGLAVGTWTVDTEEAITHVLELHHSGAVCDYLTTNVPDRIRSHFDDA